ncbi:MAG: alpha-ketoacid dehydrogenase subunit beta [Deltaproteobacteria bacterium]|nr:MAG: alpha-ketoacid dehydrogenase subunit beta [Deltaproteobacteria bacterium]
MAEMNIIQAVNSALDQAMAEDERVVVLGEDVGKFGGVFRATAGLYEKYGADRVIDTPLAEGGIIGAAIGMALKGLRPVPEIQFADFIYPAFDQIVSEMAKFRYRSAGEFTVPVVVRTPFGGGIKGGLYHSQSPEAYFTHTAGLKVVVPSNPYDAKGLLLAAIDDPDPVIFMEPKRVYRAAKGEVPEEPYRVPLGHGAVICEGDDLTVLVWGAMVYEAIEAVDTVQKEEGVSIDLIDLRTLLPLDIDLVTESVRRTGRVVVVHEAPLTGGYGAEITSRIAERCFDRLEAPPRRVTGWDTPFPYTLDEDYLPRAPRIAHAIRETLAYR